MDTFGVGWNRHPLGPIKGSVVADAESERVVEVRRRIAVVTGSRAEYGLLRGVLEELQGAPDVHLLLVVTGAHLLASHGLSGDVVNEDGFSVDARVDIQLASDSGVGTAKSVGLGVIGFADALSRLQPDVVVVLGDRFEILAAAQAALFLRIPVAHIHGGEATEGVWDEAIRHAVTKMSHLHFVASEAFRDRVVQLGEDPDRVFVTGAPGLDAIRRRAPADEAAIRADLGLPRGMPFLLVTYHPVTLLEEAGRSSIANLFEALDRFPDHGVVFTRANCDAGGEEIAQQVVRLAASRGGRVRLVNSLGTPRYIAAMEAAAAVVGNSSSGIIEAPSVGTPSVDIGERQRGRPAAASVLRCPDDAEAIHAAVERAVSTEFRRSLSAVVNPYGDGHASGRIARVLRTHPLEGLLLKRFYDLEVLACVPS
jgi:UDP-hydrolysing UDP-N-acetyl-D-glucosamine 2-epimerase